MMRNRGTYDSVRLLTQTAACAEREQDVGMHMHGWFVFHDARLRYPLHTVTWLGCSMLRQA